MKKMIIMFLGLVMISSVAKADVQLADTMECFNFQVVEAQISPLFQEKFALEEGKQTRKVKAQIRKIDKKIDKLFDSYINWGSMCYSQSL